LTLTSEQSAIGMLKVFVAVDHRTSECTGFRASFSRNRFV
jgi:hypothetical protein